MLAGIIFIIVIVLPSLANRTMWGSFNMVLKWLCYYNFLRLEYFFHPFLLSLSIEVQPLKPSSNAISSTESPTSPPVCECSLCFRSWSTARCWRAHRVLLGAHLHALGSPYCSRWWEALQQVPRSRRSSRVLSAGSEECDLYKVL